DTGNSMCGTDPKGKSKDKHKSDAPKEVTISAAQINSHTHMGTSADAKGKAIAKLPATQATAAPPQPATKPVVEDASLVTKTPVELTQRAQLKRKVAGSFFSSLHDLGSDRAGCSEPQKRLKLPASTIPSASNASSSARDLDEKQRPALGQENLGQSSYTKPATRSYHREILETMRKMEAQMTLLHPPASYSISSDSDTSTDSDSGIDFSSSADSDSNSGSDDSDSDTPE
ncbi:hypothetical protein GGH91_003869, partial [Coemansia sp. RSA 2671]